MAGKGVEKMSNRYVMIYKNKDISFRFNITARYKILRTFRNRRSVKSFNGSFYSLSHRKLFGHKEFYRGLEIQKIMRK